MTAIVTVALSPTSVDESGATNLTYTFTRTGDTSLALTVNLELGGKATAVDYATSTALASSSEPIKAWIQLLGTSGGDYAFALTTGLDGSIYLSGDTNGSLDGQHNSGGTDAFLTKYNADGTKAWTQLLGAGGTVHAAALATGLDGSIYVTGYAFGSIDGQTNSQGTFLTKYSADGTKVWTKLLGSSGNDQAAAVTTGLDGSVYVSGSTNSSLDGQTNSGGSDAFLTKYNADGTKDWTQLLGTSGNEYACALTTGLDGSIYVSGMTNGSLDGQTNSGGFDAFVTKYSANGTKAWTQLLGTSGMVIPYALATGLDGSIYASGSTTGSLDGQVFSSQSTVTGSNDTFLTKYNTDGTKAWTKLLGSSGVDVAYALTAGLDGSIYVSGYTDSSVDGQTYSGGDYDAFLTKYGADGTKVWTKLIGTSSSDYVKALTTGLDGSIYVGGTTNGSLDGQTNSGGSDAFLTKFSVSPQITFAAGSATATLVFTPTADNLVEGSETLAITVLAGSGYTLGEAVVATGTIVDTNHIPTGSTTITGTAMQGQALTATNTLADADGIGTISYQWQAAGVNISGATANSLVLAEAQVGKAITVSASYIDGYGNTESVFSTATTAVANVNDAPSGSLTVSGALIQGQTLVAANTLADLDGMGAIHYQWQAAGNDILGATGASYLLTELDVSKTVTVVATYVDGGGYHESVFSHIANAGLITPQLIPYVASFNAVMADLNGDGLQDFAVVNSVSSVGLYGTLNDMPRMTGFIGISDVYTSQIAPGGTVIAAGDWNADGLMDLITSFQGPFSILIADPRGGGLYYSRTYASRTQLAPSSDFCG